MTVPCGYCVGCRANRTSQWKLRLIYELSNWNDASFITLTFDDAHVEDNNLSKKDVQDFIKRLRFKLDDKYGSHYLYDSDGELITDNQGEPKKAPNKPIRYYAVGEYGTRRKRRHYHAILFGLSPYVDEERKLIADAWLPRCEEWQFDRLRGERSAIGTVTADSLAYVAGYIQKKLVGGMAKEEYKGRQPPFMLCSQSLGLDFAEKTVRRLRSCPSSFIQGSRIPIPRYFREKLDLDAKGRQNGISLSEYKHANEELRARFEADTGMKFRDTNADWYVHQFERWYEEKVECAADIVMADFLQRSKMRDSGV